MSNILIDAKEQVKYIILETEAGKITTEEAITSLASKSIEQTFALIISSLDENDGINLPKYYSMVEISSKLKSYMDLLDKIDLAIKDIPSSETKKLDLFNHIKKSLENELLNKYDELSDAAIKNNIKVGSDFYGTLKNAFPNSQIIFEAGKEVSGDLITLGLLSYKVDSIINNPNITSEQAKAAIVEEVIAGAATEWAATNATIQNFVVAGSVGGYLSSTGFWGITSRLAISNIGIGLFYFAARTGSEFIFDKLGLYDNATYIASSDYIFGQILDPTFNHVIDVDKRIPVAQIANILMLLDPSFSDDQLSGILGDDRAYRYMNYELAQLTFTHLCETLLSKKPGNTSTPEEFLKEISKLSSDLLKNKITFDMTSGLLSENAIEKSLDPINGIPYRYALVNGFHFAILGANYDNFNEKLSLYDPQSQTGLLTEKYLRSRAQMIFLSTWSTKKNIADGIVTTPLGIPYGTPFHGDGDAIFIDIGSNKTITLDRWDLGINNSNYIIFGTDKNDTDRLITGSMSDTIYAGAGDDTLEGKGGNDYLEGGQGNDTYIIGEGVDTLLDTDGQGKIKIGDQELKASFYRASSFDATGGYITIDRQWKLIPALSGKKGEYQLQQLGSNSNYVTVAQILGFNSESYLGLTLLQEDVTIASADRFKYLSPWDANLPADYYGVNDVRSISGGLNGYHNVGLLGLPSDGPMSIQFGNKADNVIGTSYGDYIDVKEGNNYVDAGYGNDLIGAGDGQDWIISGKQGVNTDKPDNDLIFAGGAADYIFAGDGNDLIYAEYNNQIDGIDRDEKGDFISAGEGNDKVFGSTAKDIMLGGAGEDTLFSGGGDDLILGDGNYQLLRTASPSSAPAGNNLYEYGWDRNRDRFRRASDMGFLNSITFTIITSFQWNWLIDENGVAQITTTLTPSVMDRLMEGGVTLELTR